MVTILLRMVAPHDQEDFVQRIGIYLLNSLSCQVDGKDKQLVGDLGAISVSSTMWYYVRIVFIKFIITKDWLYST